MTISKDLISSPIEAGPSLLDTQKLPPQMVEALDYVSSRLLRKHLHLTLIVVRDEAAASPLSPSQPPTPTPAHSPSLSSLSSRFRRPESPRSTSSLSSRSTSSLSSYSSSSSSSILTKPSTSKAPKTKLSLPPIDTTTPPPSATGISLLHASSLSPKATRHLNTTVAKASKKYALAENWLTTPTTPTALASPISFPTPGSPACSSVTNDLIRRSLQQNDLVFSSEGLTLLSLDRVYSFKLALSAYSRALGATHASTPFSPISPSPLSPSFTSSSTTSSITSETADERRARQQSAKAHAVEELRLLCLSHSGRAISKSYLLRAYDHLPISQPALRAVNDAYRAAFHCDGIELPSPVQPVVPNARLLRSKSGRERSQGFFIEQRDGVQRLDLGPHWRAPETPGGYDDVTPVTRGEWSELMWGREPGRAAVETC